MQQPKDFTWEELVRLFSIFGFSLDDKGKTSGSRAQFIKEKEVHTIHKPHPSNIVKSYVLKNVLKFFIALGFLSDKSGNNIKNKDNE